MKEACSSKNDNEMLDDSKIKTKCYGSLSVTD